MKKLVKIFLRIRKKKGPGSRTVSGHTSVQIRASVHSSKHMRNFHIKYQLQQFQQEPNIKLSWSKFRYFEEDDYRRSLKGYVNVVESSAQWVGRGFASILELGENPPGLTRTQLRLQYGNMLGKSEEELNRIWNMNIPKSDVSTITEAGHPETVHRDDLLRTLTFLSVNLVSKLDNEWKKNGLSAALCAHLKANLYNFVNNLRRALLDPLQAVLWQEMFNTSMKNMSAKDILEIKIRCLIEVIQDLRAERVVVYDKKIDNLKPIVMRLGAKFKTSRIHKVADKEKNASIVAELASGDTRVLVTCVFQPERLHVGNFDMFVFMGIIEEVKRHTELIGDLGPTYKGRWIITFTEDYNIRTFENCLFNQAITPRNIKEEVSINATVRRGVLSYYALECERQNLSKVQKDCLTKLQSRIKVPYDRSLVEHEEALKSLLETGTPDLWQYGIPGEELSLLFFKQFKERAYLWKDPSTDFRGGGFISLENLLYFARNFPKSFHAILHKTEGHRVMWEYPVALASVNITFMLIQMLNLDAAKQRSLVGATFLKCLAENDSAFDLLYCITFKLMDSQWLAMRALYMDFNAVMESTRRQLEKELLQDDITQLEDLPSFFLLSR